MSRPECRVALLAFAPEAMGAAQGAGTHMESMMNYRRSSEATLMPLLGLLCWLVSGCAGAPAPPGLQTPAPIASAAANAIRPATLPAPLTPTAPATHRAAPASTAITTQAITPDDAHAPSGPYVPQTYYVDGQTGADANSGSPDAPWQTIAYAVSQIAPGDTVVIAAGVYRISQLRFGPGGLGAAGRTVFKAAPGARVIISAPDDTPPAIFLADYVRLEGLWFGGIWKHANRVTFQVGGSPIGLGKQLIDCTIFGYDELSEGSSEYFLYQGNRFVRDGNGRFSHPLYLSGGSTPGSIAQHSIVDNNIFVDGEGYGIHGWHDVHSNIITRNFIGRQSWGLVLDGSDHVVANNFFWKMTGQAGQDAGWGAWLPAHDIVLVNNLFGPEAGLLAIGPQAPGITLFNHNAFIGSAPKGQQPIVLTSGEAAAQIGASEQQIDGSLALLDQLFAQPVADIYRDQRIEPAFASLRLHIPAQSPLAGAAEAWFDPALHVNVGPDSPAPATDDAFWLAFHGLGLKDFNRYGAAVR